MNVKENKDCVRSKLKKAIGKVLEKHSTIEETYKALLKVLAIKHKKNPRKDL
jgi:hypothetical protein